MKMRPISLSMVRLRKTSPQAQWKKWGMVPRIFPWVPLPAPGAPKRRMVRYFIRGSLECQGETLVGSLCVLVPELNLFDFGEGDHNFLGRLVFTDMHENFVGGNARNPVRDVLTAHGFDQQDHFLVRIPARDAEEAGKFRFEKPAVEHERAALENLRLGNIPAGSRRWLRNVQSGRGRLRFVRRGLRQCDRCGGWRTRRTDRRRRGGVRGRSRRVCRGRGWRRGSEFLFLFHRGLTQPRRHREKRDG